VENLLNEIHGWNSKITMLFHIFDLMKIGVDVIWAKDLQKEFLKASWIH